MRPELRGLVEILAGRIASRLIAEASSPTLAASTHTPEPDGRVPHTKIAVRGIDSAPTAVGAIHCPTPTTSTRAVP